MFNLIFFGAPGAGKGTQAKKVCKLYNLVHLSTGDILRSEITAKTELGLIVKKFMDKGELLPDDVIIKIVESKIKNNKNSNGFVFDGFPRTIPQAEAFDKMLENLDMSISHVIYLDVEKDELFKRLMKRAELENRKDDQDKAVIENRIEQYNNKTEPLKQYYSKKGKLKKVEGVGDVEDIAEKIKNILS